MLADAASVGLMYAGAQGDNGTLAALHPDCGDGCGELLIPFAGIALSGVGAMVDWAFFSTETVAPRLSLRPTLPMGDASRGLALALRF
jgi:hypothetical protein